MVMCLGRGADLHMAQLMLLPLTVSCSSKFRLVLPFWYWLTQVDLDKEPLKRSCDVDTEDIGGKATQNGDSDHLLKLAWSGAEAALSSGWHVVRWNVPMQCCQLLIFTINGLCQSLLK